MSADELYAKRLSQYAEGRGSQSGSRRGSVGRRGSVDEREAAEQTARRKRRDSMQKDSYVECAAFSEGGKVAGTP